MHLVDNLPWHGVSRDGGIDLIVAIPQSACSADSPLYTRGPVHTTGRLQVMGLLPKGRKKTGADPRKNMEEI